MDRERVTSNLLSSLSGVLIFVALAYFIDLNGFSSYAPILLATGILILFWPRPFTKALAPLGIITKPLLFTISHVLIFLGAKVYLEAHLKYWWVYLIIGIIFLNKNKEIANTLFPDKR